MTNAFLPVPDQLIRAAITIEEASHRLGLGLLSDAERQGLSPDERVKKGFAGRKMLTLMLINGHVHGYAQHPSGQWYRLPQAYWLPQHWDIAETIERAAIHGELDERTALVRPEGMPHGSLIVLSETEIDREAQGQRDVNAVMAAFGKRESPAVRLSHADVVAWCREWIGGGNGNGMDKAWLAFHADPKHAGLSRDDAFRPAWSEAKRR